MARVFHDDVFRRLCRARESIREHHAEALRLPEMARTAGLSRFHFLRLFQSAFGETPHQYLTRVRLDRAKELLAGDRGTVTDVCLGVGFSSLGSFSSLFARQVGCAPSAYRRRLWVCPGLPLSVVPFCFMNHFAAVAAS